MKKTTVYQPISCNLYDYLEQAATRRHTVRLELDEGGEMRLVEGIILDLFVKDKVEYLRLDIGKEIRLDHINTFNGIAFDQDGCQTNHH